MAMNEQVTVIPEDGAMQTESAPMGGLSITADHAKQSLFQSLDEEQQDIIGRVIYAGMKALFADKKLTDRVVEGIRREDGMDISDKLGIGVGHTLVTLFNESKSTIPLGALLPAGYVLLAKMCEFVNDAGLGKVTDEDYGEALQMMNAVINKVFNPMFNKSLVEQGKEAQAQGQQTQQQAQQQPAQPAPQPQPAQPGGLLSAGGM
jgi:hypothetical protein